MDVRMGSLLVGCLRAASGAGAPGLPSAAAAASAAGLGGGTKAAGQAWSAIQGPDFGAVLMAEAAASEGPLAAVEPVAVETAWGPEVGTLGGGWGELWAAWPPFQHPPSGFAGTDGSVFESWAGAAGRVRPAVLGSCLAAAASGGIAPEALGWSEWLGRICSYSRETGPYFQLATEDLAAKASVSRTWCSPGALSVCAAVLGTEGVEGMAGPVQQREQPGPLAVPAGRAVPVPAGEAAAAAAGASSAATAVVS